MSVNCCCQPLTYAWAFRTFFLIIALLPVSQSSSTLPLRPIVESLAICDNCGLAVVQLLQRRYTIIRTATTTTSVLDKTHYTMTPCYHLAFRTGWLPDTSAWNINGLAPKPTLINQQQQQQLPRRRDTIIRDWTTLRYHLLSPVLVSPLYIVFFVPWSSRLGHLFSSTSVDLRLVVAILVTCCHSDHVYLLFVDRQSCNGHPRGERGTEIGNEPGCSTGAQVKGL